MLCRARYAAAVTPLLLDAGKPWQIGTTESFNGKLRNKGTV
jgi:hypothetical protein